MDVRAGETGVQPDPFTTAVFQQPPAGGPVPEAGGQGQLFPDSYPAYADTNKIPSVASDGAPRRPRPARWLRVTVALVALLVVAAAVALGLVEAGVIGKGSPSATTGAPATHHPTTTAPQTPLLTPVSTGAATAAYRVDATAYSVTVSTSTGASWVSVGTSGQPPVYAGILGPGSSQKETLLGASEVNIGASGTTVVVSSGQRSATLTPPSAPFTYQFLPKG